MAFELEDAAVVGADALEHAVAVEQAVVEDADRRFGGRPERAAHIHEAVARVKAWRASGAGPRATLGLVSIRHSELIMPKRALRQTSQSVNGLFRALGVDAKSLPRTRPLYRRLVDAARRRDRPRRRAGGHPPAAGARSRGVASASAGPPSSAPTASSRRAAWSAATSDAARSCRRSRTREARRSPGAARSPRPRCRRPIRRFAIWCAPPRIRPDVARRRRAGARLLSDATPFSGR